MDNKELDWSKYATKLAAKMASFGNHSGKNDLVDKIGRIVFSVVEDADARIAELEAKLKERDWISVEDRLPEIGADVLIRIPVCSHFNVENGTYRGQGQFVGAWCDRRGEGCTYKVSQWMPLPSPPKDAT